MKPMYRLSPTPPAHSPAAHVLKMFDELATDIAADQEKFGRPKSFAASVYIKGAVSMTLHGELGELELQCTNHVSTPS